MKLKIELIECDRITASQARGNLRTIDKEFAANLARSIKLEGMYQPIVVRQNPKRLGQFLVLQGLHRLYATKDLLKLKFIECIVLPKMDDAEYELAMISGNLWRLPLSDAQQTLAVKRWYEFDQSDQVNGPGRSGSSKDEARGERPSSRRVPGLPTKLADASGLSLRQAERNLRIANAFDVEQLKVLERKDVTSRMCTEIAKIKDSALRNELVSQIAKIETEDRKDRRKSRRKQEKLIRLVRDGMQPDEAFRQVTQSKVSAQGGEGSVGDQPASARAKHKSSPAPAAKKRVRSQ
jgi:hypothetical protein